VKALREVSDRGVKVRVWGDAAEAVRLSEFDVEAQLGGRVQGSKSDQARRAAN
jgi:hypothetical protein